MVSTNVAEAFLDRIKGNGVVYAYDSNVSFGPFVPFGTPNDYSSRLAWDQSSFDDIRDKYGSDFRLSKGKVKFEKCKDKRGYSTINNGKMKWRGIS